MSVSKAESEPRLARTMPARTVLNCGFGVFGFVWAAKESGREDVARLQASRVRAMVKHATVVRPGRLVAGMFPPTKRVHHRDATLPATARVTAHLWVYKIPCGSRRH
jgi:hypothetical protein